MALVPLGTSSNSWVVHSNDKCITAFKKPKKRNAFKTISSLKRIKEATPKIEMISPVSHVLDQTKEKQERLNLTSESVLGEIELNTLPSKLGKVRRKRKNQQSTISRLMQERMRQSYGRTKGGRVKNSEEKKKKKKKNKKKKREERKSKTSPPLTKRKRRK